MDRISVLIPDAEQYFGRPVAYCLKTRGNVVHALARGRSRSLPFSNLFASFEYMDEPQLGPWLKRIEEIVTERKIDVVMPVSEYAIRALSEHGHSLSCANKLVRLPEHRIFEMATDKASLAKFLAAHGLPLPPTVVVTVGAKRPEALSSLDFPVLAKPPLGYGGHGIKRFETPAELDLFLTCQREGQEWVVQEFIEGRDLGVSVLCQDGDIVACTVQHAIAPSQVPFEAASDLEYKTDEVAIEVIRKLMGELRWSGVANIDMRLRKNGGTPLVLEINGRYWRTLRGALNAGVNFPLLACETVFGSPTSNRQAHDARYFEGLFKMILSLFGGGRYHIKPSETEFGYFLSDPLLGMWVPLSNCARTIRDKLARLKREPASGIAAPKIRI